MPRHLSPEERAVWRRVTANVRNRRPSHEEDLGRATAAKAVEKGKAPAQRPATALSNPPPLAALGVQKGGGLRASDTLDGSWDKRIAKGALDPDFTIDLHGDTLASAHARLNRSLSAAIRAGARVVLLITGRPATDNPRLPPTSRGVIRASVKDWLTVSPQSGQIAAIRNAHPRHGGAGALYIILRRVR